MIIRQLGERAAWSRTQSSPISAVLNVLQPRHASSTVEMERSGFENKRGPGEYSYHDALEYGYLPGKIDKLAYINILAVYCAGIENIKKLLSVVKQ